MPVDAVVPVPCFTALVKFVALEFWPLLAVLPVEELSLVRWWWATVLPLELLPLDVPPVEPLPEPLPEPLLLEPLPLEPLPLDPFWPLPPCCQAQEPPVKLFPCASCERP